MLKDLYIQLISAKMGLNFKQVQNTVGLLSNGATIPFISRYRKELTGSLDEVQIAEINQHIQYYEDLDKRRMYILETIEKQEKLTPELRKHIEEAVETTELEDIFLPYKPKRKTRATKARELGLEPLAMELLKQNAADLNYLAKKYLSEELKTIEEILQGARDIIAEQIAEDTKARNVVRKIFEREALISSKVAKGKEDEGIKYKDYFNWSEQLKWIPSHRFLAIVRGNLEKILSIDISIEKQKAIESLQKIYIRASNSSSEQVYQALIDGYTRLLKPSIETEFFNSSKQKADKEAIRVFVDNLRTLLLSPPLGKKRVLAIDPGFRTGCKIVTLDEQGNLLHNATIYPFGEHEEVVKAINTISTMVEQYKIDVIAIGNGTASQETEKFIKKVRFNRDLNVYIVDESGASIYSASKIAREEFPQYDVTVRGAVSIGRRLLDPLSELVKIDPQSIGVGQYQHDVDQKMLKESLDLTVESCVNMVGVDINTASKYLLTYVSGLGEKLAENIVEYRKQNGRFTNRQQIKQVKLMGDKTYEQCAGFLRITDGDNPLDASAVHPEAYKIVEKMAAWQGVTIEQLIKDKELQKKIDINQFIDGQFGKETLNDILKELAKPGRDPRQEFKAIEFDETIKSIDDLFEGMIIQGIVKNVTNFGAFVDIGIKINGLIHVSEMADGYVKNPTDILKVHQHVRVKVTSIDKERSRIGLSIKGIKQI